MLDLYGVGAPEYAKEFAQFISSSPTSYHAVREIVSVLRTAGFREQDERSPWEGLDAGYVRRAGAVIAWQLPRKTEKITGFRIVGSHTDSPAFRLKPNPNSAAEGFSQANVEVYGGPLLNSWLNRDLGLAGVLVTEEGETRLVRTPPILTIPQTAPHLDRPANNTLPELSAQRDCHPIWALGREDVFDFLCARAGLDPRKTVGFDIFTYDTQSPALFGGSTGTDFLSASRQDNLTSVFAALQAFVNLRAASPREDAPQCAGNDISVFAAFDHEEIGSASFSGAHGPFLRQVLKRISLSLGAHGDAQLVLLANSSCLSADAGHSVSPNKPHLHDPDHHPVLGAGPLLKINADQRYATESRGSALWHRACTLAGQRYQKFVSNNDVPCGSTIGPATARQLGIVTVDVGAPLLSMHSVREISSPADLLALAKILSAYYRGA